MTSPAVSGALGWLSMARRNVRTAWDRWAMPRSHVLLCCPTGLLGVAEMRSIVRSQVQLSGR